MRMVWGVVFTVLGIVSSGAAAAQSTLECNGDFDAVQRRWDSMSRSEPFAGGFTYAGGARTVYGFRPTRLQSYSTVGDFSYVAHVSSPFRTVAQAVANRHRQTCVQVFGPQDCKITLSEGEGRHVTVSVQSRDGQTEITCRQYIRVDYGDEYEDEYDDY